MTLDQHCSIVTGGSRGLGKAIALTLAERGADVVVGYREDGTAAEEVAGQIGAMGRKAKAIQVDVAQRDSCEQFVEASVDFLGRLDSMVNNAGSLHVRPFLELTGEEWDTDIDVNLGGVFHCSQFASREMVRQGRGGAIAIVTSCGATLVGPQQAQYCASKAGATMLARAMAYELGKHQIRVNCVAPGPAGPTDLNASFFSAPQSMQATNENIPLGRIASPEDVARAVAYIVSDDAAYVTGTTLAVDGGYTLGKDQTR